MLARRASVDESERLAWSKQIEDRLAGLAVWRDAAVVHTYVGAVQGEVATRGIVARALREGKTVVCPRVRWKPRGLESFAVVSLGELTEGSRGLWEPDPQRAAPVDDAELDLVLVPGIAFDRCGWRIGFGAGLYDRFLAGVTAPRVALAFSLQIQDSLPVEPHDEPVDWIVTEGETIACRAIREQSEREAIL
ncbi:MAG TPA: 5-formyltetrahydrofolate cyclo-ligase [Gemmatimonadota bacterium]|nr:5-formyltetrahydrofolate cyclo-ligase [Gemmatimonadota bacterium]